MIQIIKHTGKMKTEKQEIEVDGKKELQDVEVEITEVVMVIDTSEDKEGRLMQAARLDVELHNRDNADEWSIKEA